MRLTVATVVLLCAARAIAAAPATTQCQTRTLVAVTDDMGHTWPANSILPVDIERDTPGGAVSLCAHGGSCLTQTVAGQPALKLLNCKRGPSIGDGDFRLVAAPQLTGPAAARRIELRQSTDEKLSGLGFSNAAAGSLADTYVQRPHSPTGRLVARALAGSQSALATLKKNNQ